jgi:hypothetical protein
MNTEIKQTVKQKATFQLIQQFRYEGKFVYPQPFTPVNLIATISDQLNIAKQASIAVLFTVEWAMYFKYKGFSNITVITNDHDRTISRFCELEGLNCYTLSTIEEKGMKFDVIVGNPPFKNGNEPGGKSSLWRKFVARSWNLVTKDGYHAMIAPQFPNSAKDLGKIFYQNQTQTVWTKISHHFPGVGSSFFAWVVKKTPKKDKTNFIDEQLFLDVTTSAFPKNFSSISIIEKMLSNPCFECKSSPEYFHTSVADGKNDSHLSSKPGSNLPYFIRRTSGANYYMFGAVLPTDYYESKVVMTFSGNPHYKFHDANSPVGTIKFQSGHIIVKNETEGDNLIHLYNSKLYKFIQDQQASGGFRGKKLYELPIMPLNKKWSDAEIYAHFNLTPSEIELVENVN